MPAHKGLTGTDIHVPYAFTYANASARGSATGFAAADVGKLALQLDNASLWLLSDDSPVTWVAVGSGLPFSSLTSTPTTLAGYGISDAASDSELAAHEADTTSVHGIADTSALLDTGDLTASHNHTSAGADGGVLTNDAHDGYSDYTEIAAPSTPAANTARLYAKDVAGVTEFFYKNSAGTERDLSATGGGLVDTGTATYLDFSEAAAPSTPASGKVRIYAKSDGSLYQKDDAGTETGLAGGGGGGDSTTTDAYASRPAASNDGNLFLPNNSFYIERDTGSAWASWAPIFPMTPPVDGDFSWVNQGGAAVTTTNGGILLTCPTDGSTHNLRIRKKSAPATPYTITGWFIPNMLRTGGQFGFGLGFRQASDGKCHVIYIYNSTDNPQFSSTKFSSATGFDAHYGSSIPIVLTSPICLRISDDGTNRKTFLSYDGVVFRQMSTIGRTDYLTADEVFFYGNSVSSTWETYVRLLSWKEG